MQKIVFFSLHNAARSQMAEGLARQQTGANVEVFSAGAEPSRVHAQAIAAMAELDIDIADQQARTVNELELARADIVVTLGPEEITPALPASVHHLHWPISDPAAEDATPESFRTARDHIQARVAILARLIDVPEGPPSEEFHASIRVHDLAESARFYAWLLQTWPKEWTHRYVTFLCPQFNLNFVLTVSDGMELHHDTLYHVGIGVPDRATVIDAYHRAVACGATISKPPRTTWRGTPLHELWLHDPDGTAIEIYARLTEEELARKPADLQPEFLVPGTEPADG